MISHLERRMIKLEEARRDLGPGAFFIWALDEDSQPEAVRSAIESGQVQVDDPIILGVWKSTDPMPAPHWANGLGEINDAELQIIIDIVSEAEASGEILEPGDRRLREYSDGELLGFMANGYRDAVAAACMVANRQ